MGMKPEILNYWSVFFSEVLFIKKKNHEKCYSSRPGEFLQWVFPCMHNAVS